MITLYHQIKTSISFWCRQGLNLKSLIQPSKILLVELTGTYKYVKFLNVIYKLNKCNKLGKQI